MMGHKEKLNWIEDEVFSGWRKVLHWRPGVIKKIKRKYWKRMRRKYKKELDSQD